MKWKEPKLNKNERNNTERMIIKLNRKKYIKEWNWQE